MNAAIIGTRTARYQTNDYKNKEAKLGMKIPGLTVSYESVSKRHRAITSRFIKEVCDDGVKTWAFSAKYHTKKTVKHYAKYFLTHCKFAKDVADSYALNPFCDLEAALDVLYDAWGNYRYGREEEFQGDSSTI